MSPMNTSLLIVLLIPARFIISKQRQVLKIKKYLLDKKLELRNYIN